MLQVAAFPIGVWVQLQDGADEQNAKVAICRALNGEGVEVAIPTHQSRGPGGAILARRALKARSSRNQATATSASDGVRRVGGVPSGRAVRKTRVGGGDAGVVEFTKSR